MSEWMCVCVREREREADLGECIYKLTVVRWSMLLRLCSPHKSNNNVTSFLFISKKILWLHDSTTALICHISISLSLILSFFFYLCHSYVFFYLFPSFFLYFLYFSHLISSNLTSFLSYLLTFSISSFFLSYLLTVHSLSLLFLSFILIFRFFSIPLFLLSLCCLLLPF